MAPVLDYWFSAGRDTLDEVAGIRPTERQSSLNQYPIHKPATASILLNPSYHSEPVFLENGN
jgi:hypothetical protein